MTNITTIRNRNKKKNNCMGICNDKLMKSRKRRLGHEKERKPEEIESLLKAENIPIWSNYVRAKINPTK